MTKKAARAQAIATRKRKKYNPERRVWRGRSYKKGGERVADLKRRHDGAALKEF